MAAGVWARVDGAGAGIRAERKAAGKRTDGCRCTDTQRAGIAISAAHWDSPMSEQVEKENHHAWRRTCTSVIGDARLPGSAAVS